MKKLCLFMMLICVLIPEFSHAQIRLGESTTVFFATVDDAKKILMSEDDFVQSMSPFDRAARMKTDTEVSEREYLEFVGNNALAWNDAERQKMTSAFQGIQKRIEALPLPLPKEVFIVKTTGNEEGGAAYTRINAIIFPKDDLVASIEIIQEKICHELFHIVSRMNPEWRDKLYAVIGFVKTAELEFPVSLKSRKITNPDAPKNDHCIRIQVNGKTTWVIPVLFSSTEKYDTTYGGEFFDYLQFQFLVLDHQGNFPPAKPIPVYEGHEPQLLGMEQISGFFEQVGRNTRYIIHPEEILADNFALLIFARQNVPSPEIIRKLEEILKD